MKVKDDYEGAFKPDKPGQTHPSGMGTVGQDQQMQQTGQGLKVRIAATHAGIITRNNGFYLPDKMKKGSTSFTDNFPKPVLVHHEEHQDPIGRVYASDYIDTSGTIQDQFNLMEGMPVRDKKGKEIGVITDVLLKDFVEAKMPYGMQVDTVRTLFRDSFLSDDAYSGLGHIQIVAFISDRAAIEKLLDGRYLTGSVGATTDKAICSVCRQDWTKEGKCEHKPGGLYDGQKCFIITGNLLYDEYSFVNKPADRHSKVLELHYNGIQDAVESVDDYQGRIYEVRLGFPQYDSVSEEEDTEMAKKKKEEQSATPEVVIEDSATPKPAEEGAKPEGTEVQDGAPAEGEVQDEATPAEGDGNANVEDETAEGSPEATEGGETSVQDDASAEESLEDFLVRVLDAETLSVEDEDKLYEAMWEELKDAVEKGECECDCEDLEDAKLSSEKRKKLAKSTFCGPDRSFPVPDCAHVTAARRLIGKYKGKGSKKTILDCVNRKAKALGCGSAKSKKDEVQDNVQPDETQDAMHHARLMHVILAAIEENHYTPSEDPALTDEEKGMLSKILKRLAGMVGKDSIVQAMVNEGLALSPEAEQAMVDEVAKNEDTIGELRDELVALRKEYSLLHSDMEVLQDSLVDEKTKLRKAKENHLSTLVNLRDAEVKDRDWTELEDSAVDSEIERTLESVDMSKITDKLGDGTANIPTEDVEDPSVVQDDNSQKRLSVSDLEQIEAQYHKLLLRDGLEAARGFIRRLQMEGKLPQDGDE